MSVTQGSATFIASGLTVVSSRPIFDQARGNSWEVVYEGLQASVATYAATLQADGARTSVTNRNDGMAVLTANFVRDPSTSAGDETPFYQWSIVYEESQESLFSAPEAIIEANAYGVGYRNEIEEAVANSQSWAGTTSNPIGAAIQKLLRVGIETRPVQSPFLRRTATYSLTYPGAPYRVSVQGIVYTRSSLVSTFGIVDPLASRIPFDPDSALPDGFVYGWYLAQQEFNYSVTKQGAVQVNETIGFRFGIWNAAPTGALYILT